MNIYKKVALRVIGRAQELRKNRINYQCAVISLCLFSSFAAKGATLNNPYPAKDAFKKIYYTSFSEQPKTLDPAKSYSVNEYQFIMQIYEPVLQYDYLARPHQLVPLTATQLPDVRYYDKSGQEIRSLEKESVAHSIYTIHIKPGIYYQPHPAFAKNSAGYYRYENLPTGFLNKNKINQLTDFHYTDTRELVAEDYIYQIKRLATPAVNSPIYGLMSDYIAGFKDYAKILPKGTHFIDLRQYPLSGVKKIDKYTFQIDINGLYPQFIFWLAMPFFSPIPWEVDRFYAQPGMDDKNLDFGWYPVGTGAFLLSKNNPNSRMVLTKNPNFREMFFPKEGTEADKENNYLKHAGERLPLIDKAVYTLEKESIPRWNKFLQGYYDASGVTTDSFDKAIQITPTGSATLTPDMQTKGIRLKRYIEPSIHYIGFNMMDAVVGGNSARARILRHAISIAVNFDEDIAIFYNGRGRAAQGPLPPGIFGFQEGMSGINPYVYRWEGNAPKRRTIEEARALMRTAGYPEGRDPTTGKALILHYDVSASGGPDDKAALNWMQKQFARLGIALDIRATQYNRFQEKIRSGNVQLFTWSWIADYPDPENFLFLFYGPNGKVAHGGENAVNYYNPVYDQLFDQMKNRGNDETRKQLIKKMEDLLRYDAPWIWGVHNESFILSQQWVDPMKSSSLIINTLKYMSINVPLREDLRRMWNKPVLWPMGVGLLISIVVLLPFFISYRKRQQQCAKRGPL